MSEISDLKEGILEFVEGGRDEEEKKRYRLAVTAYFKAMVSVCDLFLFKKTKKLPTNHTVRFELMQRHSKDAYEILSRLFKTYRESYTKSLDSNACKRLREGVGRIAKITKLDEELKVALKKAQE